MKGTKLTCEMYSHALIGKLYNLRNWRNKFFENSL